MPLAVTERAPLLEALSHERRPGDAIASDGDNTIWEGDIGDALFELTLREGLLREEARSALTVEAARCGVDSSGDATAIARRLAAAQREGRYDDLHAYAMQAWCFAGWSIQELETLCDRALDEFGLEDRVFETSRAVIDWAREHEVPFWLVSASCTALVRVAARRLGLSPDRVVAMDPAVEGGVVMPHLAAEPTHAAGKVRRLRTRTGEPLLAGMGDSVYDAELLREARIAIAVRPKPELRAALEEGFVVES